MSGSFGAIIFPLLQLCPVSDKSAGGASNLRRTAAGFMPASARTHLGGNGSAHVVLQDWLDLQTRSLNAIHRLHCFLLNGRPAG